MAYKKSFFLTIAWLMCSGIGGALVVFAGAHLYLSPSLPSVDSLRDVRLQTPLRIYSNDGKLIGEVGEKRRTPVKYQDIPQPYIDALLSAEDAQFYSHHGVSIKGLMRAFSQILMSGDIQGGGSTITMQVARNFFLTKRQEFKRKFNEILLALRIERELSKEQILELYVNVIFLGNRAYGIQAAAQVYYGHTLDRLTVPQLAMLAGIPKAPSTKNPLANPKGAVLRRNWILGRMLELGKLSEEEYTAAINAPDTASYHGNSLDLSASYVAEMARQKAIDLFGQQAYTDGYRVYTTIDSNLQNTARKAVINGLLAYDDRHGYRGPEQKLPVPQAVLTQLAQTAKNDLAESSDTEATTSSAEQSNEPDHPNSQPANALEQWYSVLQEALEDIPTYAELFPAAVIEVHQQSVKCLLEDGKIVNLAWQQGLSDANPYNSVYSVGQAPESAGEFLALGDVIRLGKDSKDNWHLYQIPDAQAALVSLNPRNGAILSLVGGLDFRQSNFNRAIQAKRQPGSNFKPFLYTAALEHGFTAASIINDAPIVFDDEQLESAWRPENSGGNFYGPTRLRKALYLSRNLVSIRLLRSVGINEAIKHIDRFGINKDDLPKDLSLALGSYAMTPLEVATGYAVLANGGYKVEPYYIERILNYEGQPVFEALPPTVCYSCNDSATALTPTELGAELASNEPFNFAGDAFAISRETKASIGGLEPEDYPRAAKVIDDQVAYIMDSMLKDVVQRGTATKAKVLKRGDIAGKTGTTNSATDTWFSGYAGDLVTTTWLGFDQMTTLGREFGSSAALPIWIEFMAHALKKRPEATRPRPPGLVTVRINPVTGKRARTGDPDAIFEIFRAEHVPELDDEANNAQSPWDESSDVSTEAIF